MPWPTTRRIIGTRVQRIDGPDKSTGRAKYTFDINRPGMLHARILRCPHAHARVTGIDTAAAERVPGYRTHYVIAQPGTRTELFFAGAEVLAIAADTEEHAEDVLRAVRVDYEVLPFQVKEADALRTALRSVPGNGASNVQPGGEFATQDFANQAYRNAAAVVEKHYAVPVISHQCLEPHGLVAEWDAALEKLTVWASTQAVPNTAGALARHFRIPATSVRCITHYIGGGFGSKFGPDIQGEAAAELARRARAPVKLMLDRAEEVTVGGMRPSAIGTVKIAAANNQGQVQAFEVDVAGSPGVGGGATVNFTGLPYVYTTIPNVKRRHQVVRLNTQNARAMRAPGHPQSCFLTEQAMDDLAARLNVNPLEMRLLNLPPDDAAAQRSAPQSYNALRHTIYTREIAIARELSAWDRKWHRPGEGGRGPIKHGMGMALHTWGGGGGPPNEVKVSIANDGSVLVQCSTQDLGTAERTVLAIVVAEVLGLNVPDITIRIGESQYGRSTPSGGSTTTPGTSPAAFKAASAARDQLFAAIAPRLNLQPGDLSIDPQRPGRVVNRSNNNTPSWREACSHLQSRIEATGNWNAADRLSNQGVGGVQIAEVRVDAETGVVRCTRMVAVQDCGLIINKQGCESQVAGGVIMGVNYALLEERIMDRVTGRQCNPDMEFYKVGGIQDIPKIVVHMMDMPERGVIGIGEPPTISTCAAIANAVFNAVGVRVGEAPFTPDRVLAALASRQEGSR